MVVSYGRWCPISFLSFEALRANKILCSRPSSSAAPCTYLHREESWTISGLKNSCWRISKLTPTISPWKELDISPKITEASVQSFILLEVQDRHLFSADFLTESQDWSLVVPCLLFWAALVASPGHGLRQGWRAVYEMRGKSWQDFVDMLVWGGVGTHMDVELPFLLCKWATTLTIKSAKRIFTRINHAPVAGPMSWRKTLYFTECFISYVVGVCSCVWVILRNTPILMVKWISSFVQSSKLDQWCTIAV